MRISLRDVSFAYRPGRPVLSSVSLDIESGEVLMVLGRSGAGKTTLLKLAAGLLKPQSGSVVYEGLQVDGRRSRAIAYVPQAIGIVENLTVLENALLGALGGLSLFSQVVGSFPREAVSRAKDACELLGLGDYVNVKAKELSGGQKQRVAIARALVQGAKIVLADEFVSQLDPLTSLEVLELTRDLRTQGIGFAITTHDVHLVPKFGDKVAVIRDGRIALHKDASNASVEEVLSVF
ncbi:MAG: ATP-binding cassette domain-containing protein [Thaumarchaeota archaeon]|nr:ATP-binding cassette domain-containing protein [Candidatus Calditenuaceae archaeon]MDW8042917.1 ATP-binding cassette domain-containing protein [Nitrososphaerota archaeon]